MKNVNQKKNVVILPKKLISEDFTKCRTCKEEIFCRAYSHHWKHVDRKLDKSHTPFPKMK